MLKIYRLQTLWPCLTLEAARFKATLQPGAKIEPLEPPKYGPQFYRLTIRREFLREHHIDGKTLARLLPAWAKPKKPKSIGHLVSAFYAENSKVVTDYSVVVGSDEWLIAQDDPHRAAHYHLFQKYGMYADEFPEGPEPFDWRKDELEKSRRDMQKFN